jgi:pyrimidine-specific ribonucleoside hydrolase
MSAIIMDTDAGGDPDDAVALLLAARLVAELALVVTSDEVDGERARFARYLLDLAGRPEVPVVAGRSGGRDPVFSVNGLVPPTVPAQPTDVMTAVRRVTGADPARVRWLGIGPLSNLADVLSTAPDLAENLDVTQMGGALCYRDPTRAEHNFRMDPDAARVALAGGWPISLVTSEVTFNPAIAVSPGSVLYVALTQPEAPPWSEVLRRHLDQWFDRYHPTTLQHDGLTLSAAIGLPFVEFARMNVAIFPDARMAAAENGIPVSVSVRADYAAFNEWLLRGLVPWAKVN